MNLPSVGRAACLVTVGLVTLGCTDSSAEELEVESPPVLTADAQWEEAIRADGSPVGHLVDSDLVPAITETRTAECTQIDDRSSADLDGSNFLTQMEELNRAHPSTGAELRAEITFVAGLLGQCRDGVAVSGPELAQLSAIVDRWGDGLR